MLHTLTKIDADPADILERAVLLQRQLADLTEAGLLPAGERYAAVVAVWREILGWAVEVLDDELMRSPEAWVRLLSDVRRDKNAGDPWWREDAGWKCGGAFAEYIEILCPVCKKGSTLGGCKVCAAREAEAQRAKDEAERLAREAKAGPPPKNLREAFEREAMAMRRKAALERSVAESGSARSAALATVAAASMAEAEEIEQHLRDDDEDELEAFRDALVARWDAKEAAQKAARTASEPGWAPSAGAA